MVVACSVGILTVMDRGSSREWAHFCVYLLAVLLSSGQKVALPNGKGSMSVNFPFIFLAIVQLSPFQAIVLAALSVFAQCRFRVLKSFTFVQIAFNLGNVVVSTALSSTAYHFLFGLHLEIAPALAAAAAVYFFANTIPVAFAIGWSNGERPYALWRRDYPWYLPFYVVGAFLAAIANLISTNWGWVTSLFIIPIVYVIYRAYRTQISAIEDRQKHLEETKALHLRTIEGLAMAIEAMDQNTHDHLLRVRIYVSEIGRIMGLEPLQMEALRTASYLHDIGKLAVPEHIINKPGKLTPEEFDKMKIHPVVGADILERVRFPYPVTPIVRSHHEAWDGSGYPDGLKGEEIPIGARILTVVDSFDAMASDRPYRRALSLEDATEHIKKLSGKQFDPAVVKVLEENYVELEKLARSESQTIVPLQTNLPIAHGAAPGAGFEQVSDSVGMAGEKSQVQSQIPNDGLTLISSPGKEAQAIFEMSRCLGNSFKSNETALVMSNGLHQWISFDCFAIYRKQGDTLVQHYKDGIGAAAFSSDSIPVGQGLSGWVAKSGKPIVNGNPEVEPNYIGDPGNASQMCSALSLPLQEPDKEIFGVLSLYSSKVNSFSMENLRMLMAVGSKLTLALENGLIFQEADLDARVDYVTQLPNLRQFTSRMEEEMNKAVRSGEPLGIVVCDLNSFKSVNDKYGHAMGNKLLRALTDGFKKSCENEEVVARTGGDEFVFLLPGAESRRCIARIHLIQETVREACEELHVGIAISASSGAAFFPEDSRSSEALLDIADRRMYLNKRSRSTQSFLTGDLPKSELSEAS